MYSSSAAGWWGAVWTWREQGEGGQLLKSGTLANAYSGTETLCTYASISCYAFEVGAAGDHHYRIYWAIP